MIHIGIHQLSYAATIGTWPTTHICKFNTAFYDTYHARGKVSLVLTFIGNSWLPHDNLLLSPITSNFLVIFDDPALETLVRFFSCTFFGHVLNFHYYLSSYVLSIVIFSLSVLLIYSWTNYVTLFILGHLILAGQISLWLISLSGQLVLLLVTIDNVVG